MLIVNLLNSKAESRLTTKVILIIILDYLVRTQRTIVVCIVIVEEGLFIFAILDCRAPMIKATAYSLS